MPDPIAPDFTGIVLPWEPASHWRAGDWDAASLIAALKAQTELADYADDQDNAQGRVRLDVDANGNAGYWVTVPAGVDESAIDAGIAAYVLLPPDA